jgi:type III pantothenate kinase
MNLVIDIGNSASKAAIFLEGDIVSTTQFDNTSHPGKLELKTFLVWIGSYPGIQHTIISSVRKSDEGLKNELEKKGIEVQILTEKTPIPLVNRYLTPDTLGKDRLAAAVGAHSVFPDKNVLVVDAGTAITIDMITSGAEYLGGNISPGLNMRFRALNEFTDRLPLLKAGEQEQILGDSTESAIRGGVQWGILFEIDEYINRQKIRYPDLEVVLTGGDAILFDKNLKNSIFVDLNLNLKGLHRILESNVGA